MRDLGVSKTCLIVTAVIISKSIWPSVTTAAETKAESAPVVVVDSFNGTFAPALKTYFKNSNCVLQEVRGVITPQTLEKSSAFVTLGLFNGPVSEDSRTGPYSVEEINAITDYVAKGGTLITAGFTWAWVENGKPLELHPMNQLGKSMDFHIEGYTSVQKFTDPITLNLPDEQNALKIGSAFSRVEMKGKKEILAVTKDGSTCGAAALRGNGKIFVFGHEGAIVWNPTILELMIPSLSGGSKSKEEDVISIVGAPSENKLQSGNLDPIELATTEAPNAIKWATSPLTVAIPQELRANLSLLREDLLDHGRKNPASKASCQAASDLCDGIIATIDRKEVEQAKANYNVAKRAVYSPLSNQALEARRNYKMSWPQYDREVEQRTILIQKKADNVSLESNKKDLEWTESAVGMRQKLDQLYQVFRHSLRN